MKATEVDTPQKFDVCVVGGGPAGLVLGLLLARRGVRTCVLEKHADFLRDFRGDTVHPSTLDLLAAIGLAGRVRELPGRRVTSLRLTFADETVQIADFTRLRVDHPYLYFVPQWDLLEMLARAGAELDTFTLLRRHEVTGLLRAEPTTGGQVTGGQVTGGQVTGGQVTGVEAVGPRGPVAIRARLTVGADGRESVVRASLGLPLRHFGAPMDVLWFRLPRRDQDGAGLAGQVGAGRLLLQIDRGDYWQIAYVIPKGGYDAVRARGLDSLRHCVAALAPRLADRVEKIRSWDDVRLLSVRVNRARRWHAPGALVIGDAAHAMSPLGGVGINLAVQDAVAAARLLADPLLAGRASGAVPPTKRLAAVQRRRTPPTVLTQLLQRAAQRGLLRPVLDAADRPITAPAPLRLLSRAPAIQGAIAYAIGMGVRPELPDTATDTAAGAAPLTRAVSALAAWRRRGGVPGSTRRSRRGRRPARA